MIIRVSTTREGTEILGDAEGLWTADNICNFLHVEPDCLEKIQLH